jgi:indolepyruvate ferredoxin oxidoreductase beta subunit
MGVAPDVTNIVVAGLGGQGVLKATDILADAIFRAGHDIKKSEVHGMSQRGGSVCSDVRFGREVFSPMVPPGEADLLVVLAVDQVAPHRHRLKPGGVLIHPQDIDATRLANRKSLNVALLGLVSTHLALPEALWLEALTANLPPKLLPANLQAFALGRQTGRPQAPLSPTQPSPVACPADPCKP